MPKNMLTTEQIKELTSLLRAYPNFFNELFSRSFVTNMRAYNSQIYTVDENRINDFIKVLEDRLNKNPDDTTHLTALVIIDEIRAEIKNHSKDAADMHAAAVYSFKGKIGNKDVHLRDDLGTEPEQTNFFDNTDLGSIIAKLLLDKNNQIAIKNFAESFEAEYSTAPQKKPKNTFIPADVTLLSPEERGSILKAIFSSNKEGTLSKNEKLYQKWLLPLLNINESMVSNKYQITLATTVYRLWLRKFLDKNPSLQQIHEELHLLIHNRVTYMDRENSSTANIADKFCYEMAQLLLKATKKFDSNQADIALIQYMASWPVKEIKYISQNSKLQNNHEPGGTWEFFPSPSYKGDIGIHCIVQNQDNKRITLTHPNVIIEDADYDAEKVTSFITYDDANNAKLLHHVISSAGIARAHTYIEVPQKEKGTPINLQDPSTLDYIPNPEEFNKQGGINFAVSIYDTDNPKNAITGTVLKTFPGFNVIPQDITLSKNDNVISFNINQLLGISHNDFNIVFIPGISPEIGSLISKDIDGSITLRINPAAPEFREHNKQPSSTYNFDANLDLRFQIASKKDKSKVTYIALNVPLADLQNPAITTLKPQLKFIINKRAIQYQFYKNEGVRVGLKLIDSEKIFSPHVIEIAKYVTTTIAEIDKNNNTRSIKELLEQCGRYIEERSKEATNQSNADLDSMMEDLKTQALNAAIVPHLIAKIEAQLKNYKDGGKEEVAMYKNELKFLKMRSTSTIGSVINNSKSTFKI